jgi:hypothetical protein
MVLTAPQIEGARLAFQASTISSRKNAGERAPKRRAAESISAYFDDPIEAYRAVVRFYECHYGIPFSELAPARPQLMSA